MTPPIFLLTDFGDRSHYTGQVKAVLARLAPESRVYDISHSIEPFAIDEGAWVLEVTEPHLPEGAIVVAAVDPGVGGSRAGLAVRGTAGRLFVGPDNGLFSCAVPAGRRQPGRQSLEGTGVEAVEVTPMALGISPQLVSPTFHARDLFSPAAASLASGATLASLGGRLGAMTTLGPFEATVAGSRLDASIIHVDRFGNLITTIRAEQLRGTEAVLRVAGREIALGAATFEGQPRGTPFWHFDSSGFVAIAINLGSAAEALDARRGAAVVVEIA